MQIKRWTKPGSDEVRYYISTRFAGAPFLSFRDNGRIDGMWIGNLNGEAHVMHKTVHGVGCATERADGLDERFGLTTWAEWEKAFNACLTKNGNFSVAKFMKYIPEEA